MEANAKLLTRKDVHREKEGEVNKTKAFHSKLWYIAISKFIKKSNTRKDHQPYQLLGYTCIYFRYTAWPWLLKTLKSFTEIIDDIASTENE